MRTFTLKDTVYQQHITVVVGTMKEMNRLLARRGATERVENDACGQHIITTLPSKFYKDTVVPYNFIWLVRFNGGEEDVDTFVHEAFHCTCAVMKTVDIEYKEETNNEAFAHYLGMIVRQGLPFLKEK